MIGGSIFLVFLGFLSARVTSKIQNNERAIKKSSIAQGPDIAIALSGSLEQSVPPSWTFVQQNNVPIDIPYSIDGAVAKQELLIRSLQGTRARLLVYSKADALTVEKTIAKKNLEEIMLGVRKVFLLPSNNKNGIQGILLQGSSEIVILWMEKDQTVKSFVEVPGELKDLLQSLRVQ